MSFDDWQPKRSYVTITPNKIRNFKQLMSKLCLVDNKSKLLCVLWLMRCFYSVYIKITTTTKKEQNSSRPERESFS